MSTVQRPPIAVVGVSALFPGSQDATGFWKDIRSGADLLTEVPTTHWLPEDYYDPDPKAPDKTYAKRGGFIPHVDFDAASWGVPPKIIKATDTSQLLGLIVAEQVLRDAARGQFESMDRSKISVILGVTSAQELLSAMISRLQKPVWVKSLREHGVPEDEVQAICQRIADHYTPWEESSFPGLLGNVVAGRIANRLDLGGTNCVTDAACASTFAAVNMAANELYLGDSDLVITGGVDTLNDIFMFMCFSKTPALSASGDCRPFSDAADGTMLGEGLGMVALKRLPDAERDGDYIYAVLRGIGSSSDGKSKSVYAPVSEGQAKALRRAQEHAGFDPRTVELIEAHGTGTKAGDAAEFEGLRQAFPAGEGEGERQWCALGSVKSQVGHTKAAAGAAGLFKIVMALHHKVLPPTIKVERPNPKLDIQHSAFYLNTQARPWIRGSDHPRRAGVSAFGFGGSNFHLLLEEYVGPGNRPELLRTLPAELVVIGGADGLAVARQARQWAARCDEPGILGWAAWRTQQDFDASAPARLAVVAADAKSLRARLERAAATIESKPDAEFETPEGTVYGLGARQGSIGLLFPGQGSQYVQMGAELAMNFSAARGPWDRAAASGLGLERVVFPIPRFDDRAREADELALRATQWAQPAIGCASASLLAMLGELGIEASAVGGHSFGEITALHAAGVLSESDMLRIARRRGELMAQAGSNGQPGTMSAVVAAEDRVREVLAGIDEVVLANLNAPKQTVISGPIDAIAKAEQALEQAGMPVRRLPVASAFHSPVVAASAEPFTAFLNEVPFGSARVPVYSGESATPYEADPTKQRERLGRQIAEPVRFTAMVTAMVDAGVHTFIEVGPGAVLTNLVGQILAGRPHVAIALDRRGVDGATSLLRGLAKLVGLGVPIRWQGLWSQHRQPEDPGARTQAKLAVPLCGSNPEKPYPPLGGAAELPGPNPPRPQIDPVIVMDKSPVSLPSIAPSIAATPVPQPQPMVAADGWLAAWQEAQRQTAETHALVHRAMADSHAAYLRATESGLQSLAALAGGVPVSASPMPAVQAWTPAPAPAPMPMPVATPMPIAAAAVPAPAPVVLPPPAPVPAPAPVAAPIAAAPKVDLEAVMLSVVADKTGYPAQMLELSMDMESELGIDSIKRVEILAAVQEQAPGLPQVDAAHMGTLRTLGQIVEYMQSLMPAGSSAPAAAPIAAAPKVDLEAVMLSVVADKTGYPAQMLELSMDMESELGIDSIKRVEILAAVQEQAPGLPQVDAAHMGTLRTLGQIVEYMQSLMPASASASARPQVAAPIAAAGKPKVDLEAVMLSVVADKTGYPVQMLELSMDMESELGIDSIKRVEILAAVQEQAPELPQVDAAHMGTLRTLGQIVGYMQSLLAGPTASAAPTTAPAAAATKLAAPLGRYALELVDAPALGFARLGLHGGVVVTSDGGEVAKALVAELASRGLRARCVDEVPADADAVVFLGGLREVANEDEAIAINREAFHAARTVAARFGKQGGLFVTVQDTGGAFGLEPTPSQRAWSAGLPAMIKTAKQEWPRASLAAIDLDRGGRSATELARAIADELLLGGGELEVGLSAKGERRTLRSFLAPIPSATGESLIGRNDVVVVSGGARGVTAACVIEWAQRTKARFVLLGRTALEPEPASCAGLVDDAALKRALLADAKTAGRTLSPSELSRQVAAIVSGREVRATLAAVAKAGGEARFVSVDVQDQTALAAALNEVRREWGPIVGLVHGAGVLADKRIAELTDEQFDRAFDTKITGLRALLHATAGDPLRVLCMFSSVSARCGNNGQVAYAMANEILNKVAQEQARTRGGEVLVKSLGWGPWEGGMVSPQLRAHFAELGVPMIPLAEGARMFADELSGAQRSQIELVLGGEPRAEALLVAGSEARVLELEVHIDRRTHAYLADHSISGTVVVPVVLAVEWFSRLARAFRPDLHLRSIQDIRVLKGIKLHGFEAGGDRLTLRCRQLSNGDGALLELELDGEGGVHHYRARAEMARTASSVLTGIAPQPKLRDWGDATIYGDVLFHGREFQVIEQLDGVGEGGIAGTLKGVHEAGWKWDTWQTDVAALDGGLQLVVLWARDHVGGAMLPMSIGELRIADQPLSRGPVRVVASCRKTGASQASADVLFLDQAGTRLSELRNAQLVIRPDRTRTSTSAEA